MDRRRALLIGAAVALGAGHVAVSFSSPAKGTPEQAQAVADAYAAVSTCMVGEGPVRRAEAADRLRDVRLALAVEALGHGEPARGRIGLGAERWPGRCLPQADALEKAALADPEHTAVAYYAVQLAHALRSDPKRDGFDWIADVYQRFISLVGTVEDATGLPAGRGGAGTAGPPRLTPVMAETTTGAKDDFLVATEMNGSRPLRLLIGDREDQVACVFGDEPGRSLAAVTCKSLPEGAAYLASAPRELDVAYWGDPGLLDAGGGRLLECVNPIAAGLADDGSAVALDQLEDHRVIRQRKPGGEATMRKVDLGCSEAYWKPFFIGGYLVWHCFDDLIHVLPIDDEKAKPFTIGNAPSPADMTAPWSCQLAEGPAIVVPGTVLGHERSAARIAFRGKDGWGESRAIEARAERVRCDADSVTITGFHEVQPYEYELVHERCTVARCEARRVALREIIRSSDLMPPERTHVDVADLGGVLALAWKAGVLGVHLRVAPFEELATAPTQVVVAEQNGIFPFDVRLDARGDAAVVTMRLPDRTLFARVNRTGVVTPLIPTGTVVP